MSPFDHIRMDKTAFSIVSTDDPSDEIAFWQTKTPQERLAALELMRQTLYGYDPMGIPPFRIEVLNTLSGVTFDACFKRRVIDMIDGVEMNIIRFEDLKRHKRSAGRNKDLADLDRLP